MALILKNTTALAKQWAGIQIPGSGSYTVQEVDRARLLSDATFLGDIASGAAVVNDGTSDLASSIGLLALKLDAIEGRFNNASNGFVSTNIQSAIEESRVGAIGKIVSFTVGRSGSASNAFLYQGDPGLTTNDAPLIIPANCKIIGITATSNSGGRSYDIRLNISKYNQGTTVDRTLLYQVRNTRNFIKMDYLTANANNICNAGDKITVYCQNQGAAPTDLAVVVYAQLVSDAAVSLTENFLTAFTITLGPITITLG